MLQQVLFSQEELSKQLQKFAGTLKAPQELCRVGQKRCGKVINRLSVELINGPAHDFEIHSSHIGGSLVRETDVLVPEFDLILQVEEPGRVGLFNMPYFLDLVEEILKKNQGDLKIVVGSIEVLETFVVTFMFSEGIVVNMRPLPYEDQSQNVILTAHLKTIEVLEIREQFMRDQNQFSHDLTRLVKFWFRSKSYLLGVEESTVAKILRMVELICVAASMEIAEAAVVERLERNVHSRGQPSMLKATEKVFEILSRLGTLKLMYRKLKEERWHSEPGSARSYRVILKKVNKGNWERYPLSGLQKIPCYSEQRSFIMEPGNLQQNVLLDFSPTVIMRLMNFGVRSLQLLEEYSRNIFTIKYNGRRVIQFVEFFEPPLPNKRSLHLPQVYSFGFLESFPYKFAYLDVESQDFFMENPKVRCFTNMMMDNMQLIVKSVIGQGLTWKEMRSSLERAVRNYGKRHIPVEMRLKEGESFFNQSYDVTFYVPFGSDSEQGEANQRPSTSHRAVWFGMSWMK